MMNKSARQRNLASQQSAYPRLFGKVGLGTAPLKRKTADEAFRERHHFAAYQRALR